MMNAAILAHDIRNGKVELVSIHVSNDEYINGSNITSYYESDVFDNNGSGYDHRYDMHWSNADQVNFNYTAFRVYRSISSDLDLLNGHPTSTMHNLHKIFASYFDGTVVEFKLGKFIVTKPEADHMKSKNDQLAAISDEFTKLHDHINAVHTEFNEKFEQIASLLQRITL